MGETTQPKTERVLVAIDGTEASERAVRYVGRMLRDHPECTVRLFHVLPAIRSDVLELASTGATEAEQKAKHREDEKRLQEAIETAEREGRPIMERLRAVLIESGFDEGRIEAETYAPLPGESIARSILLHLAEHDCHTIVVGRHQGSWLGDLFGRHVSEKVLHGAGEGHTLWVVG